MDFEQLFSRTISQLEKVESCLYAVCGGIAAMVYRPDTRFTGDIDFALDAGPKSVTIATGLLEDLGLKANAIRIAQLSQKPSMSKKSSPIAVIVGRHSTDKTAPGVDFLMPVLPWIQKALKRAQDNVLKLGKIEAPFITAEDVILAKLPALETVKRRGKDWDDIQSIISSGRALDLSYLAGEIEAQQILVPREIERELPKALSVVFKRLRSERKNRG